LLQKRSLGAAQGFGGGGGGAEEDLDDDLADERPSRKQPQDPEALIQEYPDGHVPPHAGAVPQEGGMHAHPLNSAGFIQTQPLIIQVPPHINQPPQVCVGSEKAAEEAVALGRASPLRRSLSTIESLSKLCRATTVPIPTNTMTAKITNDLRMKVNIHSYQKNIYCKNNS
jgi:hypothetical protein